MPDISWSIWIIIIVIIIIITIIIIIIIVIIIIHLEIEWQPSIEMIIHIRKQKTHNNIPKSCGGYDYGRPSCTLVSFRGQPQTKFSKGQSVITCINIL